MKLKKLISGILAGDINFFRNFGLLRCQHGNLITV